ncbi:hypothetical protein GWI33_001222 [Rhynchophorus ferrugineus]|uniref:Uncharacterized protein n=1 Tax=Rhynchophorus ferrugineus TaxID=354439 RepID=A0A834ILH9_RHYFE|nr:hypothetical protein GWI33_001222 [Rhynchophorus ferrugineus]
MIGLVLGAAGLTLVLKWLYKFIKSLVDSNNNSDRYTSINARTETIENPRTKMTENQEINGLPNGDTKHWTIGDDDSKESYDDFPPNEDDIDHLPPAAPSVGQGGLGGLSHADQIALLERRKRLK